MYPKFVHVAVINYTLAVTAAKNDITGNMVLRTSASFQLRIKAITKPVRKVENCIIKIANLSPIPAWIFSISLKKKYFINKY